MKTLRQDTFALGMLAAGSLGIGLLANGVRSHRLPLFYASPKERLGEVVTRMSTETPPDLLPLSIRGRWQNMGLDELQELVAARKGTCIDARAQTFYQAGHIPGAMNLPRENFEKSYARMRTVLEAAKTKPIVVYCSEADCKDSELVADALGRLGYPQLFVYKEGWEEWLRAGLPQEAKQPF